ncbi:hypothetical protein ABBQ38_000751 [Trebouxia sp. C0009 RCD-2024]
MSVAMATTVCEEGRQHVPDTLWQSTHDDWMLSVKEYDGSEAEDPAKLAETVQFSTDRHIVLHKHWIYKAGDPICLNM